MDRSHRQVVTPPAQRGGQVATTHCLLCGDCFNGATGLRIHMDRSHRQVVTPPAQRGGQGAPPTACCAGTASTAPRGSAYTWTAPTDSGAGREHHPLPAVRGLLQRRHGAPHTHGPLPQTGSHAPGAAGRAGSTTHCLLCGDCFNGATGLRIHMDRSHRQAAKCGRCDSWFLNAQMLQAHSDSSAGECRRGHSACPLCGATFSSEELMWKHHDEQHTQEYSCHECNKSYSGLRKYKWHVENKHAKKRAGGEGGKPRKRPSDYKGNKNFVCDICGKDDFPFLSSLRFHQRKHTDEKPHECSVCRKAFKEKLNLKVHMTIHTDERRYQCPHCPKAFRQFSHRTVHIRVMRYTVV
ncbi:hypothetical protein O0L34_g13478 [Tuta absoluta]|nr:hypothetical protein O0L34_g13478 [Tuta absoluta]